MRVGYSQPVPGSTRTRRPASSAASTGWVDRLAKEMDVKVDFKETRSRIDVDCAATTTISTARRHLHARVRWWRLHRPLWAKGSLLMVHKTTRPFPTPPISTLPSHFSVVAGGSEEPRSDPVPKAKLITTAGRSCGRRPGAPRRRCVDERRQRRAAVVKRNNWAHVRAEPPIDKRPNTCRALRRSRWKNFSISGQLMVVNGEMDRCSSALEKLGAT